MQSIGYVHTVRCNTHMVALLQLRQLETAERSVLQRLRNDSIVQHEAQRAQVQTRYRHTDNLMIDVSMAALTFSCL